MTQLVYKVTGPNGEAHIARNGFVWPTPKGKRPGKWVHCEGELVRCQNGLHACVEARDLLRHVYDDDHIVWFAEAKGDSLPGMSKVAYRSLRLVRMSKWSPTVAWLFAADCAERAMKISGWNDKRSFAAIKAVRQFALGKIEERDMSAAAEAAWAARSAAARLAAKAGSSQSAVERSAVARLAVEVVVEAVAGAVLSAAEAAVEAAARVEVATEIEWQNRRLMQYLEHGVAAMEMECK